CILELCDPDGLPVGRAIRLAREVSRIEPNLAPSLGAYVCHLADSPVADARLMQRALELLCAVSDPRSFATTCERVTKGNPVANAMVRWLASGTERRLGRRDSGVGSGPMGAVRGSAV
ncbi:MAG: hypothetical protein NTW28_21625, partial [Candidatus Solibacter sp.]|nr:hypothetical protein [Candidatus Solibacter sp.]